MFAALYDFLCGCWHRNYSFPITPTKGKGCFLPAARLTGTYVVCLDCGKEMGYDWNKMRVVSIQDLDSTSSQEAPARLP